MATDVTQSFLGSVQLTQDVSSTEQVPSVRQSANPDDVAQFLDSMEKGSSSAVNAIGAAGGGNTLGEQMLHGLSQVSQNHKATLANISDILSDQNVSLGDLFKMQVMLANDSTKLEVSAKAMHTAVDSFQQVYKTQ